MTIAVAIKVHDGLVLAADSASSLVAWGQSGPIPAIANVYNNANKIFNLRKGLPIGAVTWGAGSIGPASISTLAKDLRRRFSGDDPDHDGWRLDHESYQLSDVAERVREFMYEEHYATRYSGEDNCPPLSFLVGGYSAGKSLAESYHIEMGQDCTCSAPQVVSTSDDAEAQVFWDGQPEAIQRLLAGYGTGLPYVLRDELGVPTDQIGPAMDVIENSLTEALVNAAMPIQDAIDLAEFLVNLTIGYSRFSPGAPTVGGPVEVAAITKHEHFKWVYRKHYYEDELNREGGA